MRRLSHDQAPTSGVRDVCRARRMSGADEFRTVDILVASNAETRAVDAFSLSVIKSERQLRRLFTYLVYQCPAFGSKDIPDLRQALADNGAIYSDGFINGFDEIYSVSIAGLIGEEYESMRLRIDQANRYRNKIFHGQLTPVGLDREALLALVRDIRVWCVTLATVADEEIGYDGFTRNSFRKSSVPDLIQRYRRVIVGLDDYRTLLRRVLAR
jgi:hypothetical protein